MKRYRIFGYSELIEHDPVAITLLKNLGISSKEVKCRKDCKCSKCKRVITKGEIALKTIQRVDNRGSGHYFNAYCNDCYCVETT